MKETHPNFPGLLLGLIMFVTGKIFFWIFLINFILFIYKGINLPYAGPYLTMDILMYICWGLISLIRHKVGNRGVARFDPSALIFFGIITFFSICASIYFAFYQTYVLRLEFPFNFVSFIIETIELFLAFISGFLYSKSQSI